MAGRPRKPVNIKKFDGTFREDREPELAPVADAVSSDMVLDPPSYLSREAKKHWIEYAPKLQKMGTLGTCDLGLFEMLCQSYGLYREMLAALYHNDNNGRSRTMKKYLQDRDHNSRNMGELTRLNEFFSQYRALANQFGIGPAARGKIELKNTSTSEEDTMESLINEV